MSEMEVAEETRAMPEWLARLQERWRLACPAIAAAAGVTDQKKSEIEARTAGLSSPEAALVVFGSLGRGEWTAESDVDWTLLIDGQAAPEHRRMGLKIEKQLVGLKAPGATRTFGELAFSHDIIHRIGGQADSNKNTTQRILLLLESRAIGVGDAHERVIRNVLRRYVEDDAVFFGTSAEKFKVPRFLLNDVVRFWRTMAVDYAAKKVEQGEEKWALRNIKLRMSRKLIFASGLLLPFGVELWPPEPVPEEARNAEGRILHLVEYLRSRIGLSPLEVLSQAMAEFAPDQVARAFGAYDRFLACLNDAEARMQLARLDVENAEEDRTFREMREVCREFQTALEALFFDAERLRPLTRKYGVF